MANKGDTKSVRPLANNGYVNKSFIQDKQKQSAARSAVYAIADNVDAHGCSNPEGRLNDNGYKPPCRNDRPYANSELYSITGYPENGLRDTQVDYRSRTNNVIDRQMKSDSSPDSETTKSSPTNKRCLLVCVLVVGFLITASTAAAVSLYFLGFFTPSPNWKDGYNATAVFSNNYNFALIDKTSENYKKATKSFKELTERILDNSIHRDGYHVAVNDILLGSTKYLFVVELIEKTTSERFKYLLENGYREAFQNKETALNLIEVIIIVSEKYTTTDLPTTTADVPSTVRLITEIPTRITPAPVPVCKSLEDKRCIEFGYDKIGSENRRNFDDLQFLVSNGCYSHALEFICVTSYPPCENNRQRYPCKQFCEQFRVNCSFPLPCEAYLDDDLEDLCYTSPELYINEETIERNPPSELCLSDEFQCGTGICKPSRVKCDDEDDCGDYSDELYCPGYKDIGLDCDFSGNNLCNYLTDMNGHFSWILNKGSTPSSNTGPLTDHTSRNESGLYLYAEASGQYPFSVARIISVEISPENDWCLRFYYHMLGDQIESLKIYQYFANNAAKKERLLWQRSRNQGDTWKFSAVTLPAGRYQIVFEATRGDGYRGDIAIDDISARNGSCPHSAEGCTDDQFSCANGNCIEMNYVCNSFNDCGDFSDERKCNCMQSEFQCEFGMCIPLYQRCDNKTQCPDGSDERGCDTVCSYGRHKCNDGTCILPEWVCDREADCPDKTDEINCSNCHSDEWKCRDNGCIKLNDVCNGYKDCHDGSDEINCFRLDDDDDDDGDVVRVTKGAPDNWMLICFYGFTSNDADRLCRLLGYKEATGINRKTVDGELFAAFNKSVVSDTVLQQLFQTRSCRKNEVLTLTCSRQDCGVQKKDNHIEAYIVHGNDAAVGQWPWQVGLFIKHTGKWLFSCGGSLVSHHHIITAAHCVKFYSDPAQYKVVLGTSVISDKNNDNRMEVAISHIAKPSEFTRVEWGDDIAVLTLDKYITFSDNISPICLPNSYDDFPLSTQCYVSGWGKTDFYNSSSVPTNLQEAKMKLWSDEQCAAAYVNFNDKMICAGYQSGYTGNCQGDSGGPLQCRDVNGWWKLYGVFSYFVLGCNVPMQPPVFTRVQKYLSWLDDELECRFVCDNHKCLMDESARCNSIDDCGDASDELHCSTDLTCDFDDKFMCGYTFTTTVSGAKPWKRLSSGFTTHNGPVTDHTKGDGTGYFMYADKGVSYLLSPITNLTDAGCLEFSLHGRLQGFIEFAVVTVPHDVNHPSKVDISNAKYKPISLPVIDMWQRLREDLQAGRFIVVFRSFTGFISIDDTRALQGTCASQPKSCFEGEVFCDNKCIQASQVCNYHTQCFQLQDETSLCAGKQKSYQCNLENYRDCFLEQAYFDHQDWTWYKPDKLQNNGPPHDHTTATAGGHVLFLNTKLLSPGQFATISLPVKVPLVSCLKFYYNMESTGVLTVIVCAGSRCYILFHKQATDTAGWKEVQLELETAISAIEIYGYAGPETNNGKNYIAIDDISISPNVCNDLTCRPDEFKCGNGNCIIKSLMCDNFDDCEDNTDEDDVLCKDVTKMAPDMFRCDDGTYRQRHLRCDGHFDCPDNSDEINCNFTDCRHDEFSCDDGKCKNRYSKSDGYKDCKDGSDETGQCESYQFTCKNGQCISGFRYCDGQIDCSDASDEPITGCQCNSRFHFTCGDGRCIAKEYDCDGDNVAHCSDNLDEEPTRCTFSCTSESNLVILASQVCDAIPQCPQGEDEQVNCVCPFGYSFCTYGGCVPDSKICDGYYDCLDHSDEANCTCTKDRSFRCLSGMCLSQSLRCNYIIDCDDWSDELNCSNIGSGCPQGYFACTNGVCVRNEMKCDGQDNCGDGSDEVNCTCDEQTEYQCAADKTCIPSSWKCDRINDCSDGADEGNCDVICRSDEFMCNYMEYSCISSSKRCDGHYDCEDGSDETFCEKISKQSIIEALKGNEWAIICSTKWYKTWSDDICRRLGKEETTGTTEVDVYGKRYFLIKNDVTNVTNPIFTSDLLENVQSCPSGKGLQITCAEPVCGIPPPTPSPLIIGGKTVSSISWPWMAAILHAGKPICGAVLIDSKWLITAAHCFKAQTLDDGRLKYTPHYIKVVIGSTELTYPKTNLPASEQKRLEIDVESIIIHPAFNINYNNVLLNDIALVKLKRAVLTTNTDLKYICYPQHTDQLADKAKCYTAGWGFTDYRNANEINTLKRETDLKDTRLNLWTNDECQQVWPEVNSTIHLCAGSTALRPTVCQGDSGGPLMCKKNNGIWQVVGVTSFGQSNCGQTSDIIKPVIFTRVSTYSDWITNHITET